jgi:prophage regulatory protein
MVKDEIYRMPAAERITGLKKSSIYREIKNGTFPRPVQIAKRAVGWRASDLQAWIEARTKTAAE